MRHLPSDKYNVAWFKLAECVARGEKERAFGVYRLLVHSFDDPALRSQLEGDLLLSFKDGSAAEKYAQAAELYYKDGRITQAIAVYEHAHDVAPQVVEYITRLADLYKKNNNPGRSAFFVQKLVKLALHHKDILKADSALQELDELISLDQVAQLHEQFLITFCSLSVTPPHILEYHMHKAVEGFIMNEHDKHSLQQFLTRLEVEAPSLYQWALTFLEKLL